MKTSTVGLSSCINLLFIGFIKNIDKVKCTCILYTVKPAYEVTSIKQSPVLKGHIFLFLS